MMQSEFEKEVSNLTKKSFHIDTTKFDAVNFVYTWHPLIKNVGGKKQIAKLYVEYGIAIIEDMTCRAIEMQNLDEKKRKLKQEIAELQAKIDRLSTDVGELTKEEARMTAR